MVLKVYNMSILRKGRSGYQVALQSTCSHATNKYKVLMRDRYSLYFITFSLVCQNSHPLIEHWYLPMPVFGSSVTMRRHCGHQFYIYITVHLHLHYSVRGFDDWEKKNVFIPFTRQNLASALVRHWVTFVRIGRSQNEFWFTHSCHTDVRWDQQSAH